MSTDPIEGLNVLLSDMTTEITYLNEQLDKAHKEIAVLRGLVEDAQRVLSAGGRKDRTWSGLSGRKE